MLKLRRGSSWYCQGENPAFEKRVNLLAKCLQPGFASGEHTGLTQIGKYRCQGLSTAVGICWPWASVYLQGTFPRSLPARFLLALYEKEET